MSKDNPFDVSILFEEFQLSKINDVNVLIEKCSSIKSSKYPRYDSNIHGAIYKIFNELFDEKSEFVHTKIDFPKLKEDICKDKKFYGVLEIISKFYKEDYFSFKKVNHLFKLRLTKSHIFLKNNFQKTNFKIANDTYDYLLKFYLDINPSLAFVNIIKDSVQFLKVDVTKEISDSNSILIDGISLMTYMFYHDVDLYNGGQYLHLVYLFERFIRIISDFTDYYYIVFFKDINNFLFNDKCLYLSISVILAHLFDIPGLPDKVKFYKNFLENDYINFLEEKKPTCILMNDLDSFDKLKLNLSTKDNIKSIYKIFELKHLSMFINIAQLNEMTISSNRLNAFYAQSKFENHKDFKKLVNLGYEKQILELFKKDRALQKRDRAFFKKILSNDEILSRIKTLNSVLDDKLAIYSIAVLYCYFNKNSNIGDLDFARFVILLILNAFITKNLDLRNRCVKLKRKKKYYDSSFNQLIKLFQNSLAFIISSDKFSFIKLLPSTISDLFDGRILSLTFLLSRTRGVNWEPLFKTDLTSILNNIFVFLKETIKILHNEETEFTRIIDLGTENAVNAEIFSVFQNVFESKVYNLNDLKTKCFKVKTEPFELKINSIQHPLIENMVENVCERKKNEIRWNAISYDSKLENNFIVENFLSKNKWNDNYKTYHTKLKNENEIDVISNNIINELNVYSMEIDSFKIIKPKCDQEMYDLLETIFEDRKFLELEERLHNFEQDFELSLFYLKKIFTAVKFLSKKKKLADSFNKLCRKLLARMDEIWIRLIQRRPNEKYFIDTIAIIIEILNFFNLKTIVDEIIKFTKQNYNIDLLDTIKLIDKKLNWDISENRFQLFLTGDILKKETKSVSFNRTNLFRPDEWQVEFLNAIDRNESMLIVAPTSTGKTFSSFYAMEKILKTNDDSLLIYVSPTKALANQTAFSVMKHFGSVKLNGNKKVCGVFTRDFRNNLMDSKILITVPQCLFIMLMNYYNTDWPSNIKYVVFDEIHSLNGEIQTDIWEYLLLLIKCPFIALSATIGNPEAFNRWLNDLENHKGGRKVRLINYKESHTDLKKFLFTNKGFKNINPLGYANYENLIKFSTFSSDINLCPMETVELYDNLNKLINLQELDLDSYKYFKTNLQLSLFFTRNSVKDYSQKLKDKASEYLLENRNEKFLKLFSPKLDQNEYYPSYTEKNGKKKNSFCQMVREMLNKDMLPAIVFCNNRYICEQTAISLMKEKIKLNSNFNNNHVENYIVDLIRTKQIDTEFLKLIELGIGYHHSGMLPNLKSIVEALFRVGKLKLLIATATLALGIHMPCKTVVFMDDQIYLDTFQYRQASGRAGRRGFDQCGNVIFFNIPLSKIERLVGSYTTELRPHFPISVSFVMQLFDNVLKSNQARNLNVDCVINKSYWNYKYSKIKQVGYHAIFGLNFLFELKLMNKKGKFSAFSILLEKIHYHEPSNFVLYYMLINDFFHQIFKNNSKDKNLHDDKLELNENKYLEIVMLIICNLFNRIPIKNKKKSILPKLDKKAVGIIKSYNKYVLKIFNEFFGFLGKELTNKNPKASKRLSLSNLLYENNKENENVSNFMKKWTYTTNVASAFAGLSGIRDDGVLKNQKYLYLNVMDSLYMDSKVLPLFYLDENLSDYAFIFLFTENIQSYIKFLVLNGFLVGDLFNFFKDFDLILKNICKCFEKMAPRNDPVRKVFENLSYKFNNKYNIALKLIRDSKINMFDESEELESD